MINGTGNRMTQEITRQSRMAANIALKQAQVSTGKRLQRASDDPMAMARVAQLKIAQSNDLARTANVNIGAALTAQADTQLKTVSNLLARTKELTVAGANGVLSAADRAILASEIRSMADEIDAIAATTSMTGQPLFAQGNPIAIRFDDSTVFAPVPGRAEIFAPGGMSISQSMRDAASAISTGNSANIGASLATIDDAVDHSADMLAKVGLHAVRIDRLRESSALRTINLTEERSMLEDTDLSAAIAELNGMTLTLEAAQAAFARINRRTLMDFLS